MARHSFSPPPRRIEADPIDFVQVMVDLYNAGCNANRVALHLGCDHSTAQGWEKGREPRYNTGASLLLLRERYCGKR